MQNSRDQLSCLCYPKCPRPLEAQMRLLMFPVQEVQHVRQELDQLPRSTQTEEGEDT